jgi:hypothetical protein
MLAQLRAATAAMARQRAALGRVLAVAMLATLLADCAATLPAPLAGADPASTSARVPALKYRSTLGTYSSQRPVEPAAPDAPGTPQAKP